VPNSFAPVGDDSERTARRRWPRHPVRWFLVLVGLAVLWCGAVGLSLLSARDDVERGLVAAERFQDEVEPSELLEGDGLETLRESAAAFESAHGKVDSFWVRPARLLPFAGRQLASVEALSGSAARLGDVGVELLEQASAELNADDGGSRAETMAALAGVAATAQTEIAAVDLGPADDLAGPLADGRARFERELAQARDQVDTLASVTAGLADFLTGPRRYLLLAGNNAEMRAGVGMPLSYGLLSIVDGQIRLDDMQGFQETLTPLTAPAAGTDPELLANWGWFEAGMVWTTPFLTANFDHAASSFTAMWAASGREPVDGVLYLDSVALAAMLEVTGPITVDGRTIDATNALPYLLLDQYVGQELGGSTAARRDSQAALSAAVVARLASPDIDLAAVVRAFRPVVEGRHLLAWSGAAADQATWSAAGIDGVLGTDELLVAVQNASVNKVDQFVDVEADLVIGPASDGIRSGSVTVRMRNDATEAAPAYVLNPNFAAELGVPVGTYIGIVTVHLPGAVISASSPDASLVVAGRDGASLVVAARVRVEPGSEVSVTFSFDVPENTLGSEVSTGGAESVALAPSARATPIRWRFGGSETTLSAIEFGDERPHRVALP
jgi:hypothetical protein